MGKFTISMVIFHSYVSHYQRVNQKCASWLMILMTFQTYQASFGIWIWLYLIPLGNAMGKEYGRHQYESYNPIQPIITWSIVQYWLYNIFFIHNIVHDHQINRINQCNQYFTSWTNLLQWPSSLLRKGPPWSTLKWWYIIPRPRW